MIRSTSQVGEALLALAMVSTHATHPNHDLLPDLEPPVPALPLTAERVQEIPSTFIEALKEAEWSQLAISALWVGMLFAFFGSVFISSASQPRPII